MMRTDPGDDFLNLFFVRFHFEDRPDLRQVDVLPPTYADDFVPRAEHFKADAHDVWFADGSSSTARSELSDDPSHERQRSQVEQDVGLRVCDEQHVDVFERSIDESDP